MFKTLRRELGAWREWLKVLGLLILIGCGVAVIFMFWFAMLVLMAGFMGLFVLAWAFGTKITINKKGKKVGYLRWFTFHTY